MHGELFSLKLEGNQIKYYYSETIVNGEQGHRRCLLLFGTRRLLL